MISAEQDQYKEICAALRGQIARAAELAPAMTPDELRSLVGAIDDLMRAEAKAESYDEMVAAWRAELVRSEAFGG